MAQAELNPANDELAQIRESVRAVCAKFPGEYWRALDPARAYPTEFVAALTQAGFPPPPIPGGDGGSGGRLTAAPPPTGGDPPARRQRAPRPPPNYTHGDPLPPRSP